MLSRRFKAKFDATSIDEFVGEFHRIMPSYSCPSTPIVYRYIDQGLLDISNIDLPMKLKRRRNKRHYSHGGHAPLEVVIKIPDYRASTCQRLLQKEIDRHPKWFKSITFDNGSEFADMTKIKHCQIYFAHPYLLGKEAQMRTAMGFYANSSLQAKA
ncbi:MAG: hypothetical protein N5837_06725 [Lactobacillus crispatus]|nr:hypothetical protein [Lactobacillus crispatus]